MSTVLSIITINYNNATGLKKTIDSVISQTYDSIEFIIIDGASTDTSVEVLKSYEHDQKFTWLSEKDTGIYNAMNKGYRIASGEYVLFLNSGDFLDSEIIISDIFSVIYFEDILYGYIKTSLNNTLEIKKYPEHLNIDFLLSSSLPHPATFYKKKLLDTLGGYDESLKIVGDWAFNLRAITVQNATTRPLKKVVSVFDMTGISSQGEHSNYKKAEGKIALEKIFGTNLSEYIIESQSIKRELFTIKSSRTYKLALTIRNIFKHD